MKNQNLKHEAKKSLEKASNASKEKATRLTKDFESFWKGLLLQEKSSTDNVIEELKSYARVDKLTHMLVVLLGYTCVIFVFWAAIGKLDITSAAAGEVFPSTQLKKVQHLEGGIVQDIQVKEGDTVLKDQPLVILESTASGADVAQITIHNRSLQLDIARYEAELQNLPKPNFSKELMELAGNLVVESEKLFNLRHKKYETETASRLEQIAQREHELSEIKARLKHSKESKILLDEQVNISEQLLKEDLTNRYNHLELLREANALQSKVDEESVAIERLTAALQESQNNAKLFEQTYQEDIRQKLEKARDELDENSKQFKKFADNLERTVLSSPVDGIVKQLYVHTPGEVIQPGGTVLDIIPSEDHLVIEAKLEPQDVGYVHVGQNANIRLSSADAMRFDSLNGEVVFISPDTLEDKEGKAYYKVRIETNRDYFQRGNLRFQLYSGVQVIANIHTGSRTVLQYLMDPIFNSFDHSLNER